MHSFHVQILFLLIACVAHDFCYIQNFCSLFFYFCFVFSQKCRCRIKKTFWSHFEWLRVVFGYRFGKNCTWISGSVCLPKSLSTTIETKWGEPFWGGNHVRWRKNIKLFFFSNASQKTEKIFFSVAAQWHSTISQSHHTALRTNRNRRYRDLCVVLAFAIFKNNWKTNERKIRRRRSRKMHAQEPDEWRKVWSWINLK